MGHSGNSDITSNYIGAYPLEKMMEYNAYLLNTDVSIMQKKDNATLIEMLKGLSEEEKRNIIEALSE